MKERLMIGSMSRSTPAGSTRRRKALLGLCIALAIFGGTMAALVVYFLSLNTTDSLMKLLAIAPIGIACLTGLFIAAAAHSADLRGWRGYLLKVLFSAACALGSGLWMELLANYFVGEAQLPGQLVDSISNSSFDPIEFSLLMSQISCLCFALLLAIVSGRVRVKRSPVCDLGQTSNRGSKSLDRK